jgi:DNA-binding CsgD family transcriptional regulator
MAGYAAANMRAPTLVGRDDAIAVLEGLLADARRGRSGALVLRGEPGIGKTALLDDASARAHDARVLRARGLESARDLPYATLDELLRPVVGLLPRIPAVQAHALRGALALAPPVDSGRLAVAAATLSVLAAAAEERPVLAIVDDAHWSNPGSGEALAFAARRLDAEGVVLLLAARTDERSLDASGLPELRLDGIGLAAARTLLLDRLGSCPPGAVLRRLVDETGGNPLALLELAQDAYGGAAAGRVEDAFRRRAERLPAASRRALLIAAASDTEELETVRAAARTAGVPDDAFEAPAASGLLRIDGSELSFRHPLVRSTVYDAAPDADRRAVHLALARAAAPDAEERRAWHLAAAASGTDPALASQLEHAAAAVRRRGGAAMAARLLERAARLTPVDDARAGRLVAAARAAWRSERADGPLALLDEAAPLIQDPALWADTQELRAAILKRTGDAEAAHTLLLDGAARLEAVAPRRAARMLTQATHLHFRRGEARRALALAERAWALGDADDDLELGGTLAWARVSAGRSQEGRTLALRCAEIAETNGDTANAPQIAWCLTWVEDYGTARALIERVVAAHRAAAALGDLAYALFFLAELELRVGRLAAACSAAQESVQLAGQTGRDLQVMASLTVLAAAEALLGRAAEARTHATHALALAGAIMNVTFVGRANAALGLLELSLGHAGEAAAHLALVARAHARSDVVEPSLLEWMPDLVEAHIRSGRVDDAAALLEVFGRYADVAGRTWAQAVAERYRGLLAADDGTEHFEAALRLHDATPRLFERARTELCFGETLRRSGRRAAARPQLRAALETFERSGALPWADRARRELGATGESPAARAPNAVAQLTPQELQIALAVSEGRTNREVAEALFLSPKTIEYHLRNVFRKLDVRSRTELAHVMRGTY